MKKTISLITAIIITATTLLTGCANQSTPTNAPSVETEATTIETEVTEVTSETEPEVSLPSIRVSQQADKIVTDFMNELKTNVQNVDYEAFEAMYDRTVISDDMIKADWDYYYELFCGEYKRDIACKAIAYTNTEIVFDMYLYWGIINSNSQGTNWSSKGESFSNRYLIYDTISEKWVFSNTDKLNDELFKQIEAFAIDVYGENEYRNGHCTDDYQIKHDIVFDNGINCKVKSAVLKEDGSIDIVLAIMNGFDTSKFVTSCSVKIYFGPDSENLKEVVDLSRGYNIYDCDTTGMVEQRTIKYVKINVPKEKLVNQINDKSEMQYCSCDFNVKW